jgi:tRNA(Ile)-lysidine synthase
MADDAAGGRAPAVAAHVDEILRLPRHGSAALDVGGGLRAVAEYGRLRFEHGHGAEPVPAPVAVHVPGRVRFGAGELVAARGGAGDVTIAATGPLEVRARRAGDRMRPAGLGGTKTLQDLFVDRKVPRARRAAWPVVTCGGEIAWVPGIAVDERFAAPDGVVLSWRR